MDDLGLVTALAERLQLDFKLRAVMASELEFYITGSEDYGDSKALWDEITKACIESGMTLYKVEKEKGRDQHEIALAPADPLKIARDTALLKAIVTEISHRRGLQADFGAKPFADQPGSGLHIHTNLADEQGVNVFVKQDAEMSDPLTFSLGGLQAWMGDCMAVFAPNESSYTRFVVANNVPLTVSWGGNNRTVALRLPDSSYNDKRIEHRVSGADADPVRLVAVILAAIHYGLNHRSQPLPQIYGDAALAQYKLPKLPLTLDESKKRLRASKLMTGYFNPAEWVA